MQGQIINVLLSQIYLYIQSICPLGINANCSALLLQMYNLYIKNPTNNITHLLRMSLTIFE